MLKFVSENSADVRFGLMKLLDRMASDDEEAAIRQMNWYVGTVINNFDEWPDDVDDEDKYLAVPHKKDLDLGTPLVFDFAREFLPEDFDEVDRIFSRRGAYGQFKGLLQRKRLLERWYVFENAATERALKEWCDDNGVVIEGRTAGDAVE